MMRWSLHAVALACLLALGAAEAREPAVPKDLAELVKKSKKCEDGGLTCTYSAGSDFRVTIRGIRLGTQNVIFHRSNEEGDYYGSFSSDCVTVAAGKKGTVKGYAVISTISGDVFPDLWSCVKVNNEGR